MDTSLFKGLTAERLREQGRIEGRAEARAVVKARSILRILQLRNVVVTDSQRERIVYCPDPETVDRWFDRAVMAERAEELFADS